MNNNRPTFFLTSSSHSIVDPSGSDSEPDSGSTRIVSSTATRRAMRRRSAPNEGIAPRAPPSSFTYPFQAHPGNPDPLPIGHTTHSRRLSSDSTTPTTPRRRSQNFSDDSHYYPNPASPLASRTDEEEELMRPNAPFMSDSGHGHGNGNGNGNGSTSSGSPRNTLYRNSAAGTITSKTSNPNLNESSRTNSMVFRAPFLSPTSRNSSSVWTPPVFPSQIGLDGVSPTGSTTALGPSARKPREPLASTLLLEKLTNEDKPWVSTPQPRARLSRFITYFCLLLGVAGAALLIFFEVTNLELIPESQLCVVFEDDFNGGSLDTSNWKRSIYFPDGEFEVMSDKSQNLKVQNGNLYIIPTLTSQDSDIGSGGIFNGYTYDLSDCTSDNKTQCSVKSDSGTDTVLPPVESAMISTNGTQSIKYGRVQVRAKIPKGDWLWPAVYMLPQDSKYGQYPLSGEIVIMESRGNDATYPAQGFNYVRSTLNFAPLNSLFTQMFGWWFTKRGGYNEDFHTYTLEWTPNWMRMYIDTRLQAMLEVDIKSQKESFWARGNYPEVAQNGEGQQVPVQDIWSQSGSNPDWNAPFDQEFYLVLSVAAGGTSGYFPDNVGGKMWTDGDPKAMYDFAHAQSTWSATWPTSEDDIALRVDWVKMWKMC